MRSSAELPLLVLIGDSIRLGYEPLVRERLSGRADTTGPSGNCGNSGKVIGYLEQWTPRRNPDVVHFNSGLHDVARWRQTSRAKVEVELYEANLKTIVGRLRAKTDATLVFATSTPVIDQLHAVSKPRPDRFEADVLRYNEVACGVMSDAGVVVNDLHAVVVAYGPETLLLEDGLHFGPAGNALLADAVVAVVEQYL